MYLGIDHDIIRPPVLYPTLLNMPSAVDIPPLSGQVEFPSTAESGATAPPIPEVAVVFSPSDGDDEANSEQRQAVATAAATAMTTGAGGRPTITRVTSMHGEQEDASTLYARPQARRNKTRTLSEVREYAKIK